MGLSWLHSGKEYTFNAGAIGNAGSTLGGDIPEKDTAAHPVLISRIQFFVVNSLGRPWVHFQSFWWLFDFSYLIKYNEA